MHHTPAGPPRLARIPAAFSRWAFRLRSLRAALTSVSSVLGRTRFLPVAIVSLVVGSIALAVPMSSTAEVRPDSASMSSTGADEAEELLAPSDDGLSWTEDGGVPGSTAGSPATTEGGTTAEAGKSPTDAGRAGKPAAGGSTEAGTTAPGTTAPGTTTGGTPGTSAAPTDEGTPSAAAAPGTTSRAPGSSRASTGSAEKAKPSSRAPSASRAPSSSRAPSASRAPSSAPKPSAPKPKPSAPKPSAPKPPAAAPSGGVEAQVLALVNRERAAAGCPAVAADASLAAVARAHSADMRDRRFFDHVNPDGLDPFDRAARAGVKHARAENIAYGQPNPAAVMKAWMNSSGHRAAILNCGLRSLGVGVANGAGGPWWTQLFGS